MTTTHARTSGRERGIAMLMVITVLVTLVLVAVPFAMSMLQGRKRTASERARDRALFESQLLLEAMKQALAETHPSAEQVRWDAGERGVRSDPTVDTLEEITLGDDFRRRFEDMWRQVLERDPEQAARLGALKVRGLGPMNDDTGSIWTGVVEDANAKVNPTGASPYLIASLFGACAMLTEEIDGAAPDIAVTNGTAEVMPGAAGFPRDGGWIRIDREVIRYASFDGSTFRGCERGSLPDTPLGDNGGAETHEANAVVIDYTAWKLATHLIAARPGALTYFQNLEDLRTVVSWGAGGVLPRERLDQVQAFLTVWSRGETGESWLAPQLVANELPSATDVSQPDEVDVQDLQNPTGTPAYFNAGTIVRITDTLQTRYQTVANVGDTSGSQVDRIVTLAGSVDGGAATGAERVRFEGGKATIAAWAPRPINLNTAPREVLYACLANLHYRDADSPETIVAPALAWDLAVRIVDERQGDVVLDESTGDRARGPFRTVEDLGRWLARLEDEEILTRAQRAAIYTNAVNPHSFRLAFGTAPFCFRTLDVYHLEARVTVNDRGGEHAASATVREIVEIGSDGKSAWTLDSQDDFERRLSMGSGAKWVATYPRGVNYRSESYAHVQPAVRELQALAWGAYPSPKRSEGGEKGEVRLEPARIRMPGNTIRAFDNNFDSSLFTEGYRTDYYGAYTERSRVFRGEGQTFPQAFTLAFWWQCWSEANWTAFDCGMERFLNRYAIFVTDGREGPELVFRVCAGTLQERGAEIYVPLARINYLPGTWYHIQVAARGEDPSTMELLVDGVSVGRRRTFTWLSSSLTEDATEVSVESTDGFSPSGALLIGDEVVEYESLAQDAFRDAYRGARGTYDVDQVAGRGRTWPAGTPVRQLGYAATLITDVMRGGSSLAAPIGRWSAVRVDNQDDTTTYVDGSTSYEFRGVASTQTTFAATILPLWGEDATEAADAFGSSGIALMGGEALNLTGVSSGDGAVIGGWEFVYYTRASGSSDTIQIERRSLTRSGGWSPTGEYFLPTWVRATTQSSDGGPSTSTETFLPAYLIPLTIPGSTSTAAGDDYLDPRNPTDGQILARQGRDWDQSGVFEDWIDEGGDEALVLLGIPDESATGGPHDPEVIRYGEVDRQTSTEGMLYFVAHDRFVDFVGELFLPDAFTPHAGGQVELVVDVVPEAVQEGETAGGDEDLPPPSENAEVPEEDPQPDSSGAGDSETPPEETDDSPVGVVTRATYTPATPDRRDPGAEYPWPAWTDTSTTPPSGAHDLCVRFFRGLRGTLDRPHENTSQSDAAARILPCFRVDEGPAYVGARDDAHIPGRPLIARGGRPVGRNDRVTLTDGGDEEIQRASARIRWADPFSRWAAFDDVVERRVAAEQDLELNPLLFDTRGFPRILRFPCGELPEELPRDLEFARSTVSNSSVVTAFLDEVHIFRHGLAAAPRLFAVDPEGVDDGKTDITIEIYPRPDDIEGLPGYHAESGLVNLDGELILYRGIRSEGEGTWVLERCERGVMGTTARPHAYGGYGRFVTDVPVTYLQGSLTRDAASLPVALLDSAWPREGLVRVLSSGTEELLHYTRRTDDSLLLPEALDADERVRGRGLLRGRFGTDVIDHDDGAPVFFQPFRYWDRYLARRAEEGQAFSGFHDHPEAACLEVGQHVRQGFWHRVAWKEDLLGARGGKEGRSRGDSSGSSGYLDLLVAARLSPRVPWDTNRIIDRRGAADGGAGLATERIPDAIFLFDDPEGPNRIGLESETLELRFYFVYRPGAFRPQDLASGRGALEDLIFENAWKATPWLKEIVVETTSRTCDVSKALRR